MSHSFAYILALWAIATLTACGAKQAAQSSDSALSFDGQESVEFQEAYFSAQQARMSGSLDKAFNKFEQAAEINPSNDAVWYELARIQHERKELISASDYLKKAIAIDGENHWYHWLEAELTHALSRPEAEEQTLEEVLRIAPDFEEAYYRLFDVQMQLSKPKDGLQTLSRLQALLGPNPEIIQNRYQLLLRMEDLDGATALLEQMAADYPGEPGARMQLIDHYRMLGEHDKADAQMETLAVDFPRDGQVQLKLSEYYAANGQIEASERAVREAMSSLDVTVDQKIAVMMKYFTLTETSRSLVGSAYELLDILRETHPSDPKGYAMSGDYLLRDGKLEEASAMFEQAVALDPSRDLIWQQLLALDLQLNDFTALEAHSAAARDLFPVQPQYYLYHGIALMQQEKHAAAIQSLKTGRSLVLDDSGLMAQFWSQLGDAYHAIADHPSSDNAYDKALELDGDNVFVLNNYAYYLSLRGERLDQAERMSRRSNDLDPGQPSFMDTLGWIYYVQGKYTEALEWLGKANEATGGKSGEILEHLGDAQYRAGQVDEALRHWQAAKDAGGGSDRLPEKLATGKLSD